MRNGCEGIGCGVAANLQAGDASGGPIFSVLPEKIGEKRGAWLRLVHTAGAVQVSTYFIVSANTHTYPTGAGLRAACYGTAKFARSCLYIAAVS